jgi:8-oxo-dGTP pyrophosphatase MutT (NUDIX family)
MLHLIPKPWHRHAYRLAHALRRVWWRVARPRISGCRVLALDGDGRVLLVRHSYGTGQWTAPGGGLKRGEDPLLAAARELAEETGCMLQGARRVALVEESLWGARNTVHVIAGQAMGEAVPDGRELIDAAFFAPDALPAPISANLRRDLVGWLAATREGRS